MNEVDADNNDRSMSVAVVVIGWIVIVVGALVSIADLLGFLDQNSPITNRIQPLTLLLLAAFATYVIYSQGQQTKTLHKIPQVIRKDIDRLVDAIGVGVDKHPDPEKGYKFMSLLINSAKSEVLHVSLSNPMPRASSMVNSSIYDDYEKSFDNAVDRGVQYTYIAIPRDGARKKRIERLIAKGMANFNGVSINITNHEDLPPLYNFLIVDRETLVFNLPNMVGSNVWVSSRHPLLIEQFAEYFYTVLRDTKK